MRVYEHLGESRSVWDSSGTFGRVWERLIRVLENFGDFEGVLERLGEIVSVKKHFGEGFGAFGRCLREFWSIWENFRVVGRVFGAFWGILERLGES